MKLLDLAAIRARCDASTPGPWTYDETGYIDIGLPRSRSIAVGVEIDATAKSDGDFIAHARADVPALLAYVYDLEASAMNDDDDRATLLRREVLLKRAHGALADAGCVVPIELDRTIEHAINALAERALTAEERLEQRTRERDEARAQLAALDTGAPCDGHRHCCADRRRLADELLRVRAERDNAQLTFASCNRARRLAEEECAALKEKP